VKPLFVRIPEPLYARVVLAAKRKDLRLAAVVKQALELWLRENKEK
jgi:predicted HicB family RNase H-like nuclease